MATTFHPFPRLPFDIRSQIWALAAYPRLIHIRTTPKPERSAGSNYYFASMIPQAELMHVCRESRQLAPYQKAFFTTLPGDSETRYIWVNFNEDMICLQDHELWALGPHAADIQRLMFAVLTGKEFEDWEEPFTRFTSTKFTEFTALREVLVISPDILWGTQTGSYGICPSENVRFLDIRTGLMLTKPQLHLVEDWENEKGWLVQDMDDVDEELQSISGCPFLEFCSEVE